MLFLFFFGTDKKGTGPSRPGSGSNQIFTNQANKFAYLSTQFASSCFPAPYFFSYLYRKQIVNTKHHRRIVWTEGITDREYPYYEDLGISYHRH